MNTACHGILRVVVAACSAGANSHLPTQYTMSIAHWVVDLGVWYWGTWQRTPRTPPHGKQRQALPLTLWQMVTRRRHMRCYLVRLTKRSRNHTEPLYNLLIRQTIHTVCITHTLLCMHCWDIGLNSECRYQHVELWMCWIEYIPANWLSCQLMLVIMNKGVNDGVELKWR